MASRAYDVTDGRFMTLLDEDGTPPHGAECVVCGVFDRQRPEESRQQWLRRISAGLPLGEQPTTRAVDQARERLWNEEGASVDGD